MYTKTEIKKMKVNTIYSIVKLKVKYNQPKVY